MSRDRHTYIDFDDLPEGETTESEPIEDRFRVDEEIARGGLGQVSRGYDRGLDREVAIKSLLRDVPATRFRFDRELRLTARLQHPNIVPVYDGGLDHHGQPYMAMRLVHGRALEDAIAEGNTLRERLFLLPHVIAACNAVAYAHHERICHRDLKPDNILVGAYGETVVIDWGLAKDLDAVDELTVTSEPYGGPMLSGDSRTSLTQVGSVMGTPAYMPPEQAIGAEAVDQRADVYALGAVLYHLLTGHKPYKGAENVLEALKAGPPTPVSELVDGAPPDLCAVIDKAMARKPEDRYPDAEALAEELERYEAGRWVSVYQYSPTEVVMRWVRRHPVVVGLSVVLALTLITSLIGVVWANRVIHARAEQLAELREHERQTLDEVTLEQARLLAERDPARALQLLDSLSPKHPFDGAVHAVASTAWSAQPARELDLPLDRPPDLVHVGPNGIVLSWGQRILMLDHAFEPLLDRELPERVQWLHSTAAGAVLCTENELWRIADGVEERWTLPDSCRIFHVTNEDRILVRVAGNTVWVLEESGLVLLGDGPPFGRSWVSDGYLWEWGEELVRREISVGLPISGRGALSNTQMYGNATAPGRVALFGDDPSLVIARETTDGFQTQAFEGNLPWLVTGQWIDDERLFVGGGDPAVDLVDLASGSVERFPLRGRPYAIEKIGEQVVVVTDSGHLAVLTPVDSSWAMRDLGAPDEPLLRVVAAPDGGVLVIGRSTLVLQDLSPRDGTVVADLGGKPSLERLGDEVWALGSLRAQRLEPVPFVSYPVQRAIALMDCEGRRILVGKNTVGTLESPGRLEVDGSISGATCLGNRVVLAMPGMGLVIVETDGFTEVDRHPIEGLAGMAEFVEAEDRLVLVGGGAWNVDAGGQPRKLMPRAVDAIHGAVIDNELVLGTREGRVVKQSGDELFRVDGLASQMDVVDGALLVSDYYGGLWRWGPGEALPTALPGHRQYISTLEVHPQGRWAATGGWDNLAWVWDLSTDPVSARPLRGHRTEVSGVAWSADGQRLYTADRAGQIRRWSHQVPSDPAALRSWVHEQVAQLSPR